MAGGREKIWEIYTINVCGQRGEAGIILKEYSLQSMLFTLTISFTDCLNINLNF